MTIPTDNDIDLAYDQGKEAIIALFHSTFDQIILRLEALEDQLVMNGRHNGKTSSRDGLTEPKAKSLRKRHGKKEAVSGDIKVKPYK